MVFLEFQKEAQQFFPKYMLEGGFFILLSFLQLSFHKNSLFLFYSFFLNLIKFSF
nr:MAG TPA: hypothetical protein [Caudoviricetes sp.]